MSDVFSFPRTINEKAARVVAGVVAVTALVALALGWHTVADMLLGAMVAAATLESVFAFCLGCKVFGQLMRVGLVPEEVCVECSDIWSPPRSVGST